MNLTTSEYHTFLRQDLFTFTQRCFHELNPTVEFLPKGKDTELIFTEQGAFFEGADGPQMREQGWRQLLDQLASELAH